MSDHLAPRDIKGELEAAHALGYTHKMGRLVIDAESLMWDVCIWWDGDGNLHSVKLSMDPQASPEILEEIEDAEWVLIDVTQVRMHNGMLEMKIPKASS